MQMETVEVVIRLPKDEYNYIQLYGGIKPFSTNFIAKQIKNGAVLPKGHGRLIDADAVLEEPFGNTYRDIDIAETIIEADKEVENG